MPSHFCDEKTSKRLLKDLGKPTAARTWALVNQYIVDLLFSKYMINTRLCLNTCSNFNFILIIYDTSALT